MKTCPIAQNFCQSKINILQKTKLPYKNLPKALKIVPNWRNFAKSGHTAHTTYVFFIQCDHLKQSIFAFLFSYCVE